MSNKKDLQRMALEANIDAGAEDIVGDSSNAPKNHLSRNFDAFLSVEAKTGTLDNFVVTDRSIIDVKVELLHDEPVKVRSLYPEARVKEMLESLQSDGQQVPILIYPHDTIPGHYYLRAGGTRTRAARMGNIPTLKAVVVSPAQNAKEAYDKSRATNIQTRTDPVSNALAWKKMLDDGVFLTQDELAEHLKVDPGEVSRCLRLTELPMELCELCLSSEEHSNTRFLRAVLALYQNVFNQDKSQTAVYVQQHMAAGKGARQLEAALKSMQSPPVVKKRADEAWEFKTGSAQGSFRSVYSTGTVEFSVKGADEDQLKAIKDFISEKFPPTKIKIASIRD